MLETEYNLQLDAAVNYVEAYPIPEFQARSRRTVLITLTFSHIL